MQETDKLNERNSTTEWAGNQYQEENVLDQDKVPKPNEKEEEEVFNKVEVLFIFSRIYC